LNNDRRFFSKLTRMPYYRCLTPQRPRGRVARDLRRGQRSSATLRIVLFRGGEVKFGKRFNEKGGRNLILRGVLLLVLTKLVFFVSDGYGQPFNFTPDFESGDLRGWAQTGTAFRNQPTLGDNPTARGRGQPSRHQGRYWIGTYENYQAKPGQSPGQIQGDRPQGTLTSQRFMIPRCTLSFLVGGGIDFRTRVEFLIIDQIEGAVRVYHASGKNTETMARVMWDLSPHAGKTGMIRIVDESSEGWGHINADDFRFEVAVPYVIDRQVGEATEILRQFGLDRDVRNEISDRAPGTVLDQEPRARSRVPIGSVVRLAVARTEMVSVPNVIGRRLVEAKGMIVNARLTLGEGASDPGDAVIQRQDPNPGTKVAVGTPVHLWTIAALKVRVPNVLGLQVTEAKEILRRTGLRPSVAYDVSDREPESVIRQEPTGGTPVDIDTVVYLTATRAERLVVVPDVRGRAFEEAIDVLERAHLGEVNREYRFSPQRPGIVLEQNPLARSSVPRGTPVLLIVSQEEPFREVPNLRGHRVEEAVRILREAGLEFGGESRRVSDEEPGRIIDQNPYAGTKVRVGTKVYVILAEERKAVIPWVEIVAGLFVLAGGGYLVKKIRERHRGKDGQRATVRVRPQKDLGHQDMESPKTVQTGGEVRLRGVLGPFNVEIESKEALLIREREEK